MANHRMGQLPVAGCLDLCPNLNQNAGQRGTSPGSGRPGRSEGEHVGHDGAWWRWPEAQ